MCCSYIWILLICYGLGNDLGSDSAHSRHAGQPGAKAFSLLKTSWGFCGKGLEGERLQKCASVGQEKNQQDLLTGDPLYLQNEWCFTSNFILLMVQPRRASRLHLSGGKIPACTVLSCSSGHWGDVSVVETLSFGRCVFSQQKQAEQTPSCLVKVLFAQLCLILCDPMDCSPPGSSVHGILHAEYWSGLPFRSPRGLPHQGIKLGSLALKADSLPYEPPGKPTQRIYLRD